MFITNSFLKRIENNKVFDFQPYVIQTSFQTNIDEFKSDLADLCNLTDIKSQVYDYFVGVITGTCEEDLQLWRLNPTITLNSFFRETKSICTSSRSYNYQIRFKGSSLEKDRSLTLEEAGISSKDYIFVEVREGDNPWSFYGDGTNRISSCSFCYESRELPIECSCQKVLLVLQPYNIVGVLLF